jgi:predicted DNA-binding protein YlxM (UPF0122 family)
MNSFSNVCQQWTEEEEALLLEELNTNNDIETIAKNHGRTEGGIHSRCREIAYKMYLKNISMEEITKQTKLDEESIRQVIKRRQSNNTQEIKKPFSVESEITEIKNELKELKNTVNVLVEMMKAVYVSGDVQFAPPPKMNIRKRN